MGYLMYDGAVYRALKFKTEVNIWVAIGRTTAWTNEASPPVVTKTTKDITEAITYVRPVTVSLAKTAEDGDITIDGVGYDLVADGLDDQDARFLYLKTVFNPNLGQAYGDFRQIAVYADLDTATGHDADDWVNPSNVIDPGTLCYLHNDTVTLMSPVRTQTIELVLEFK